MALRERTGAALAVVVFVLSLPSLVSAQGVPRPLLDVNTNGAGSGVTSHFVVLGDLAFFAGHGEEGIELWRTDGTTEGTVLVADLRPGPESSGVRCLVAVDGALYFGANDGVHGPEVWTSDGTATGTRMVADARPGSQGLQPCGFVAAGGFVFFEGSSPSAGLWRTDGTPAGTVLLRAGGVPELAAHHGEVYFSSLDQRRGYELHASDGTPEGTRLVADLSPGIGSSRPGSFAVAREGLVFSAARTSNQERRLWVTDGTAAGTKLLPIPSSVRGVLGSIDGEVLVVGPEGGGGAIWGTDGTVDGTRLVARMPELVGSFLATRFYAFPGGVFLALHLPARERQLRRIDFATKTTTLIARTLACSDGFPGLITRGSDVLFVGRFASGWELRRSDGTEPGTEVVAPAGILGERPAPPSSLTPLGDRILFVGRDAVHGFEPWVTDGTAEGTHRLRDIRSETGPGVAYVRKADGAIFLGVTRQPAWETRSRRSTVWPEIWRTDGTAAGTEGVPGTELVEHPTPLAVDGARTYFLGRSRGDSSFALWKTEGESADPERLIDVEGITAHGAAIVGGRLFFSTWAAAYLSDGTAEGSVRLNVDPVEVWPPPARLRPDLLVYFAEQWLWRTDGTVAGTTRFDGVRSDLNSPLVVLGEKAYFFGRDDEHGTELWATDGTDAGTHLVVDLAPGPASSTAGAGLEIAAARDAIYFAANDGQTGEELWRTDGTAEGTTLVTDLVPGGGSSDPASLTPAGSRLFFAADDGDDFHRRGLAVTDGTPEGTRFVAQSPPEDSEQGDPFELTAVGEDVYFVLNDGVHGRELWWSDGTQAGTRLLRDIRPGANGSRVRDLTPTDHGIVFIADDGEIGDELWTTSCGDGVVGEAEECDEGEANGDGGSCCSASCRSLSYPYVAGETCGLTISNARLRRGGRGGGGGQILVRGELGAGSSLTPGVDRRIEISGGGGLRAAATWSRARCRTRGRNERCLDASGDALLVLRSRSGGGASLRVRLEGIALPATLSGPLTVRFSEDEAVTLDWTSSRCRATKATLTCFDP